MVTTAVLINPLRTKAVLGPEPVLPSGTEIMATSERSIIPPGMRCVIILVNGQSRLVFPRSWNGRRVAGEVSRVRPALPTLGATRESWRCTVDQRQSLFTVLSLNTREVPTRPRH
jgi:hypothetical protein